MIYGNDEIKQINSKDVTQVITIESKTIAVINQVNQEHSI